jgi:hypothetical protein
MEPRPHRSDIPDAEDLTPAGPPRSEEEGDWLKSPAPCCGKPIGQHKAVPGWMGNGCPADAKVSGGAECLQMGDVIECRCGKPSSHYGTMGERGVREIRQMPARDTATEPKPKLHEMDNGPLPSFDEDLS